MADNQDDSFNASKAEVFEALGHPTRIRILQELGERPLQFLELKRAVGLDSNGLLTFHLGRLEGLVKPNAEGAYAVTDQGKEALRMIEASRTQNAGRPGWWPAPHFPQRRVVLAGFIILFVVLGTVAVYQQQEISTLSRAASDPASVLEFSATINATVISQNQSLRVDVWDRSTQLFTVRLPLYDSPLPGIVEGLSMGPCSTYPFGVALYQGKYTLDNVTSTAPIAIYAPGDYFCPLEANYGNYFTFSPLQNVSGSVDLNGYWTAGETPQPGGGVSEGVHHTFIPGVYTLVTGDVWGNVKLFYFQVNGNDSGIGSG